MTRHLLVVRLAVAALFAALGVASTLAPAPASAQSTASAYTTGYRWDAMRRLVGIISPDPDGAGPLSFPATRHTYDADGQLTRTETGVLAAWAAESELPSAWTGFTVQQVVDITYDAVGNKVEERAVGSDSAVQRVTQMRYDANDRPMCSAVRMNLAAIPAAMADHCALGTVGTNGPDRITRTVYDAAGQVLQVRKAVATSLEQAYATYTYSANGKQTAVIDAGGNRATLTYDGFDRQTHWNFPSTVLPAAWNPATPAGAVASAGAASATDFEQYSYDPNGNRASLRKRGGQVIAYSYDALNRMTLKDIPGGTAADVYYGYDLRGLQLSARFASATGTGITNVYDKAGRLASSSSNMGGTARTLAYQFDANGNRTRVTHPDGYYFGYAHDGLDRMTSVLENGATVVTLAYDAFGRRQGRNGAVTVSYGYDAVSRLGSLAHDLALTAYDVTASFSYSPASQMVGRTLSNDAYAYTGDVNVNRGYAVNGLNQYTAAGARTLGHDANGNLASDAPATAPTAGNTSTYVYDTENRLTSAGGLATATLAYDPLGRLFSSMGAAAASETRYLYDGAALVAEYTAAGTLLRRYAHGPGVDEPLLWYDGAGASARHLLANHQGSIIAVADNLGTSLAINAYDAYGIPAAGNLGRFQYTGQIWLGELGMYHYKARVYSPTLGRFLQTDPVGYDDQINLYAYVANDPVNNTDPTGMCRNPIEEESILCKAAKKREADREIRAAREKGIRAAWKAERSAVAIGGGSPDWTRAERAELLKSGKVNGYVGHHINTVKGNPLEMASDPRNVQFVRPSDHTSIHREAGGFREPITGRSLIVRSSGLFSILTLGTGILSGRIRTDSMDNFFSDMAGIPSADDRIRENIERCGSSLDCA